MSNETTISNAPNSPGSNDSVADQAEKVKVAHPKFIDDEVLIMDFYDHQANASLMVNDNHIVDYDSEYASEYVLDYDDRATLTEEHIHEAREIIDTDEDLYHFTEFDNPIF